MIIVILIPVDDTFPDESLFVVSTNRMWFEDIGNYLVSGNLPQNMLARETRKIIQLSANYSWIRGDLFRTCLDFIIRRCVREDEIQGTPKSSMMGLLGGHF